MTKKYAPLGFMDGSREEIEYSQCKMGHKQSAKGFCPTCYVKTLVTSPTIVQNQKEPKEISIDKPREQIKVAQVEIDFHLEVENDGEEYTQSEKDEEIETG